MQRIIKILRLSFFVFFAVFGAAKTFAQNEVAYPNRSVTIVTPFSAGSGPDAVLRMVAENLSHQWKQPVVVDNRPGGAGLIAIEQARRAKPDGYTLLQIDSEQLSALPFLYPSRKVVPMELFDPVSALFRTPFFVAVPNKSTWKDMQDLINAAKKDSDSVSYGSWGVGSPGHLGGKQLEMITHTSMVHVPYKETAQLYVNLSAEEIQWAFASIGSSESLYKKGSLRYLAIAAKKRHPRMPNVPTIAEANGPPELEVDSFAVVLAPKGIDPKLIDKIHSAITKATNSEKVKKNFDAFAFERLTWGPHEISQQGSAKAKIYEKLIREGNIRIE